jgi:tetratricopeptide (TPR) repeat protein
LASAAHPPHDSDEQTAAFIHREICQLGVLVLVAIAAFVLTRAVAASNRDMSLRDAAEWYRRGESAIATGDLDAAVDAFRRASGRNRNNKPYQLALARALVRKHDNDGAQSVLLALRDSTPEDPDVNLELARVAAESHDVTGALRFYHNALYAPWPSEQADARRQVRFELVTFLLTHKQSPRAISELLAASTDLPDDVGVRLQTARLFAQAGDAGHALDQFQQALRLAPENPEALGGAGLSAFALGNYGLARTYLHQVAEASEDLTTTREVADAVLSNDPLANRLGSTERRRRLTANFTFAQNRLASCFEEPGSLPTSDALTLLNEAQTFEPRLMPSVLEQDVVEMGVDLVDRIERLVLQRCGTPTTLDRALVLIGRQHGGEAR